MEFWGAEVKAGMPLKVRPQVDHLIHISQATIDGAKNGEYAVLYVTVNWTKHVIGTLSQDHIPQISFDLVFEQEFELSHSLESGSVHFVGYKSPNIDQEEDYPLDSEEEEVPATSTVTSDGNASASNVVKADSKPKASKPAEVKPDSVEEEDDDESDEDEEDDGSDSEKVMDGDEDDSEDEEEETPKQPEPSNKKRGAESASKASVSAKKAKPAVAAATPQKTQNTGEKKKGGHTATLHPAKKGGKNANQSPKSGGQSSGGNKKQSNSGKQFGSNNKGK